MPDARFPSAGKIPLWLKYKVGGPSDDHLQTWMDPRLWVVVLMVVYPVCVYLPTHLMLWWIFRRSRERER